jgi:serine/threonine protein kinase
MTLDERFPPQPGSLIDGKFVISELIGSGGTGVVMAARHRSLGRLVAIKFMHPEFAASPDLVTRFLREARATSQLQSEHVVGIIDVGTLPSGIPYFVMEHLTGTDLATRLTEQGPFSIDEVLDYVLQALEAITEAHRHGIVHRDLKPANLLLTKREDDSDFIKVLDFGTSKLRSTELTLDRMQTRQGAMLGSPLYMAPEQIRNPADADARSDIWSIGVLMHELLTGHPPFQGRFLGEIIGAICEDDYAAPAREDLPFELAEILRRCLQKEPEDRFQSVEDLARAFLPIIVTVASQVSIERILRLPSSAPPPRPDALEIYDLGTGRYALSETARGSTSVAPQARDARDSVPPNGNRGLAAQLGLALVAAAGTLTWLNLRSQPAAAPERPPAPAIVAAAPEPAAELAAPAQLGERAPVEPERPSSDRKATSAARLRPRSAVASGARPTSGVAAKPSALDSGPKAKRERSLDRDNPFSN